MANTSSKIKIIVQMLGPVVFIYILFQINFGLFFSQIKTIKWPFLVLGAGFVALDIVLKSFRWQTVLAALDIIVSKTYSISLYWLGLLIGLITPGKLGELIKIYFLKNKGYSIFRSFLSIIIDRISDIFILLGMGCLIFLFFLNEIGIYISFFGLILILVIVFVFLLINEKSWVHKIFGRFVKKVLPIDFNDYNRFTFKKLREGIRNLENKKILYFFVYLAASWIIYFSARYAVSLSLGLGLSFVRVAIICSLMAIVSILPISVAGLGTREVSVIYLFGLFGLDKETAVLFSLLVFMCDTFVISFGLIPYLKESALIKETKNG